LVAYQPYGNGQVLFFGINSIWRWRYRIGSGITDRFWGQTIQTMGLPHLLGTMNDVTLASEGTDFFTGDRIMVTGRIVNKTLAPADGILRIQATNADSGDVLSLALTEEAGAYKGGFILKDGNWTLKTEQIGTSNELKLQVRDANRELLNTSLNQSGLEQAAALTGGAYLPLGEIDKLPTLLASNPPLTRAVFTKSLWDTWILIVMICATVSAEWLLRKRAQLP
jgi:hypothetical protein